MKNHKIIRSDGKIVKSDICPTLTTRNRFYLLSDETINNAELLERYSLLLTEMKKRNIIRSKNIVGDIGEWLVVEKYNNTPNMSNLQLCQKSTKNIDAISRNGERYSIKIVSHPNKTTGVFYGLSPPNSDENEIKKFEYVVVSILDENFNIMKMLEANWNVFLKHKKWHSRMRAWNLTLNKKFINDCKIIHGV
jgi:hypothetical protein